MISEAAYNRQTTSILYSVSWPTQPLRSCLTVIITLCFQCFWCFPEMPHLFVCYTSSMLLQHYFTKADFCYRVQNLDYSSDNKTPFQPRTLSLRWFRFAHQDSLISFNPQEVLQEWICKPCRTHQGPHWAYSKLEGWHTGACHHFACHMGTAWLQKQVMKIRGAQRMS